ncbi:hypothetical protein [Carboxylicivirga taeanensis]|uniref:hypothetical protein n=1 Tax=Carboxylicivirga taeanensis TaxID=1416875 RepID=UPI003F6DB62A
MKIKFFFFVFWLCKTIVAQDFVQVDSVQKVNLPTYGGVFYPVLSHDGMKVAFTSYAKRGLQLYHFNSGQLDTLLLRDTFVKHVVFDKSDRQLFFTKSVEKGSSELDSYAIRECSLYESVTRKNRGVFRLFCSEDDSYKDDMLDSFAIKNGYLSYPFLIAQDKEIKEYVDSLTAYTHLPLGQCYYLNPSLSPDGEKILAFGVHKGTFVARRDGTGLMMIPRIESPIWLSDEVVIGMVTQDDGHEVSSSAIVAYNLKSKSYQELLPFSSLAQYPRYNASCKKIVCHTAGGHFYIIHLAP